MSLNKGIKTVLKLAKDSNYLWALFLMLWTQTLCGQPPERVKTDAEITVGAARFDVYLPLLENKRVAVIANQTSVVNGVHLVDALLEKGVDIKKVFAPEHGFRGAADAGELVKNDTDPKTNLPIISLYGGSNKKPRAEYLEDVDIVLFDIQDVGVRFYTYISTMSYAMEACAENEKGFVVLDRPNPNGFYVDGPVLKKDFKSFVGMHNVPLVHGMTVGEYAQMVNQEGWLKGGIKCQLDVIPCINYSHKDLYQVPIKPSPNLPNMTSIYLYPSLGLFEGTIVSVGRGTPSPFQVIGHPSLQKATYEFTPEPMPGAKYPPHKGKNCKGYDLKNFGQEFFHDYQRLYLDWLLEAYQHTPDKSSFFREGKFFFLLCGNDQLKKDVISGKSASEIRATWDQDLATFNIMRAKYLLYEDFQNL